MKPAPHTERLPRNPGPPLGYQLLGLGHRLLPHALFYPMVKAGTVVAVLRMRKERQASREYLSRVLGRKPRFADVLEHFYTQVQSVIGKIVLQHPEEAIPRPAEDADTLAFLELAQSDQQALFGTFHVGNSDMIGAALSALGRKVYMVRLKVRNSPDTEALKRVLGGGLEFVWANQPADLTLAISRLLGDGQSLALQCDRVEYGSRLHDFEFLGERRLFPVTIYHLSHLFQVPAGFALSVPAADGSPSVISSGVFYPDPSDRNKTLERGYAHFQRTLNLLEEQLRRNPYIWFNFLPLNPVYEEPEADRKAAAANQHSSQNMGINSRQSADSPSNNRQRTGHA